MWLIDADALKREVQSMNNNLSGIIMLIDEAPTIEAEPVRHGRVIVHEGFEDEYYEYCSECESRDVHIGDNYCPNCGAKMDGDVNENSY